ncbi:MAG: hypothetical protein NVSMB29_00040 [Candidatus Dormibacteria bacterium]
MMYGYGNGMSWWMVAGMVLITALVIAGIACAVILVSRRLSPPCGQAETTREQFSQRALRAVKSTMRSFSAGRTS